MIRDDDVERVCLRVSEILAPNTALPGPIIQSVRCQSMLQLYAFCNRACSVSLLAQLEDDIHSRLLWGMLCGDEERGP